MALRMHPSHVAPVGIWLRDELVAPHGLSVTVAASRLGVTRQAMSSLLNGNSGLSAEMAIRFEKAFGVKADVLMRMQTAFDLAQARLHEDAIKVDRVPEAA